MAEIHQLPNFLKEEEYLAIIFGIIYPKINSQGFKVNVRRTSGNIETGTLIALPISGWLAASHQSKDCEGRELVFSKD